jgi:YVTN family beta-propeller protein
MALLGACGGRPAPPVPASPAVLAAIPVGSVPTLLAVAPDGAHVYAASDGSLTVIDTAANAVAATLRTPPNATGIAVAPDGSLVYVASLFSTDLTVLRTATNTLAPPIPLFLERLRGGFSWLALTPDGATAYVANQVNKALAVIALPSGRGTALMPDIAPADVAIAPGGATLYLAGCKPICTPGFVQTFDIPSQRFTGEVAIDGRPYRVAVAPDGARVYTANLSGPSVSVIDTASRRVVATVPVPVQPTGLAVSPDSATVWVASQTGGTLSALDAATNRVRAGLPIPGARDVACTRDGRRVYVSAEERVIALDAEAI